MPSKIVICGAGFIGPRIAHAISQANNHVEPLRRIQIASRSPQAVSLSLQKELPTDHLLSYVTVDVTKPETLGPAFEGADAIVSLVGILTGSPSTFDDIQWKGAANVARAARLVGAKLVQMSAIGADKNSTIPYARTKALGEEAVFNHCPDATVIRPSIVFGPGDGFFNRFAHLSKFLPLLPVFGDGSTKFQPVFVDDLASLVELLLRNDADIRRETSGQIIYAGGPEVFTFREIMQMVLHYTGRKRLIVPVPWSIGKMQGALLERLPPSILTLTQDQVEQLKIDNVVPYPLSRGEQSLDRIIQKYLGRPPTSAHHVLPTYIV